MKKPQGQMQGYLGMRAQYTFVLIAHAQTWDHASFSASPKEIMMATNSTRAENVTFSQQISEVAATSADIFA